MKQEAEVTNTYNEAFVSVLMLVITFVRYLILDWFAELITVFTKYSRFSIRNIQFQKIKKILRRLILKVKHNMEVKTFMVKINHNIWYQSCKDTLYGVLWGPPYTINFIVNNSTLFKVIDRVWVILMQKSFTRLLISMILPQ